MKENKNKETKKAKNLNRKKKLRELAFLLALVLSYFLL